MSPTANSHAFEIGEARDYDDILVFPRPREATRRAGAPLRIDASTAIIVPPEPTGSDLAGAAYLADRLYGAMRVRPEVHRGKAPGGRRGAIYVGEPGRHPRLRDLLEGDPPGPEGYLLDSREERVLVAGSDPAGTFHGIMTLLQLAGKEATGAVTAPAVRIRDWPAMKHRGIFVECTWGSDLMELEDWKRCIDVLAELKLNSLGVGLYGCWGVQFRGQVTQFLMTPIEGRPELASPKTIEYYSPQARAWREVSYLPPMFERDFFGEVVAYGEKRHVHVWPYFNSLGHNRLIPRAYPETSSKALDGSSVGSDFCTSHPKTYEVLFDCYDQIIDRRLAPHGVDRFHVQMDEVSDWCQCPECRDVPAEERYIEHLVKLARHLADRGIQHIGVWNDILLHDKDVTDRLTAELDRHGLRDKLVWQWYMYGHQVWDSIKPELGVRSILAPMTGFMCNYLAAYRISHFQNIYRMLRLGHRDGAEGAEPYGLFDFGYHRNYCCLAEFSWNTPSGPDCEGEDLRAFLERYAARFFGEEADRMVNALETLHACYIEPFGNHETVLSALTHYTYSCAQPPDHAKVPYPETPFRRVQKDADFQRSLRRVAARLCEVRELAAGLDRCKLEVPQLADHLEAECARFAGLAQTFLLLPAVEETYQEIRACSGDDPDRATRLLQGLWTQVGEIRRVQEEAMTLWERSKASYLHPHQLRVMSLLKRFGEELTEALTQVGRTLAGGTGDQTLPESLILGTYADY